jgi:NitT/TauT family transport system substrate-binding protein
VVYLLLNVARDQQLIEKHGKQQGVDIKVEWTQLSGGAAVNDALLSGAIDIAGAGVGPLLTLWDRTGQAEREGRGVAGQLPVLPGQQQSQGQDDCRLHRQGPHRVAGGGVSVQSRVLQYAAAKQWGDKEFNRLDKWTVAVPHPDAAAAIIAGGTEITGHFGNPPFQEQELAGNPNARIVLNSYDVLGGPARPRCCTPPRNSATTTRRPIARSSMRWPKPRSSQRRTRKLPPIYIRVNKAKIDRALLVKILKNPQVQFKVTPQNTFRWPSSCIAWARSRTAEVVAGLFLPGPGHRARELTWPKAMQARTCAWSPVAPLLQVDGVSLEYRTPQRVVRATHRVSFDVHAADRFVLLGPSGCGKSTLLKAWRASCRRPKARSGSRQRVHAPGPDRIVVFQEFDQLPPWKTVRRT